MAIHLRLRGINIPFEDQMSIPDAADRAYDRAQLQVNTTEIHKFDGDDIIASMHMHTADIQGVLEAVTQGYTMDSQGDEIDLSIQKQELGLLIHSTRNMEMVVRGFLVSDVGQAKWNNGNIQSEGRTINIADECTGLTLLVERIQALLKRQIDAEKVLTVTLQSFLANDVIGIVRQYVDAFTVNPPEE